MKGYKKEVDRAIRELDRERRKMEQQNERLVQDIKKAAKQNQPAVVKIMAKDYVRVKRSVTKFYQLRTYLQGVGLQLQTMKSVDAMASAMKNTTRALVRVNARLNIPQLQTIMRTFGMETSKMEDTTDMIGDTLDEIFSADGEEDEEDELVAKVMTELNLEMGTSTLAAPTGSLGVATGSAAAAAPARVAAPIGADGGSSAPPPPKGPDGGAGGGGAAFVPPPAAGGAGAAAPPSAASSDLAARLANLRAPGGDSGGPSAPHA